MAAVGNDGIVSCFVGGEEYAVRDSAIRAIARLEQMRVDRNADGRVGVLTIGSRMVPVFDLGRALGRQPSSSTRLHIVVTSGPNEMSGWLVDRIRRSPTGDAMTLAPMPAMIGAAPRRWFEGLLYNTERSVPLLAPQGLDPLGRRPSAVDDDTHVALKMDAAAASVPHDVSPMVIIFSTPAFPRCEARRYAISARQVGAVVQTLPLVRVPGSAPHVSGVSIWHGEVMPTIDFRSARPARAPRYVVARCSQRIGCAPVAFPVDADVTLYRPTREDRSAPGASLEPFVVGFFSVGGDPIAVLDLDWLVDQGPAISLEA